MSIVSNNALEILKKRYFLEGETTPEQMFDRVAKCVAKAEATKDRCKWTKLFKEVMYNLDFIPNSPTLMNAGTEIKNYSACFVIPVPDSMEGIFQAVKEAALISKSGGGVGISLSRIRPKNDKVGSTGGVASGPVSFMGAFNAMVECVKQGSKRRGALMGLLRVDHPDIEEFISCKDNLNELNNFNISVGITDEFMDVVNNDKDFDLKFNGKIYKTIKARYLWNKIAEHAHKTGEPGVVFIDEINRYNSVINIGMVETTNPCGEQPLLPYEACNLGSINLTNMVSSNINETLVDYYKLELVVNTAIRFLDDIIDVSKFPLSEIEQMVKGNRKIGLGVMGWGDMLYKLGIPYNSKEAIDLAKNIISFISNNAHKYSKYLGKIKGIYPNAINDDKRNATCTTLAPTGTISLIAGVSGGIEPNFALVYKRYSHSLNQEFYYINPIFEEVLKTRGLYSEELLEQVNKNNGSIQNLDLPEDIKRVFVTAMDISPEDHVLMQAAWQTNGVDNAVSKTVNLPNSATVDDVKKIFTLAYNTKCKGITVYRDGCRDNQVLTTGTPVFKNNQTKIRYIKPKQRPEIVKGDTQEVKVGCGKLYITTNINEDGLIETFVNTGSNGVCPGFSTGISRMVSLAARSGVDPIDIIDQLTSVTCRNCKGNDIKVKSCPDAIGKAIKRKIQDSSPELSIDKCIIEEKKLLKIDSSNNDFLDNELICPECKSFLTSMSGCVTCYNCGYSRCS